MGVTAENIASRLNISRAEQDDFALTSQRKACHAAEQGLFSKEIIPVMIPGENGKTVVDHDEGPRPDVSKERLAALKPAFRKGGTVTAGNSSGLNDGAAAIVLASAEKCKKLGLEPMAEWIGGALGGVEPEIMGLGPVVSTRKLLRKLGLRMEDIDLVECNEAFAAQALAVARELRIPEERLNVNGGAIALGHPVGASGCRILVTLLHTMQARKASLGLATCCIGGGMGCSTIVKRG